MGRCWPGQPKTHFMSGGDSRSRDERFRKEDRLKKRAEFLAVQQKGKKIHLQDLLVLVLPRAGARRIGITASRRVGGAVVRNRVKRLLREAFRHEKEAFPTGFELVLIARPTITRCSLAELRRQMQQLRRKLERW